jgi:sugar phosphate isomerase/epimerase
MDINPTSLVPKVRNLALELTVEVMRFAKAINAHAVVIHPGYRFPPWRTKHDQIKMFERVLRETYIELAKYSAEIGIPLLLENGNYYISARNGIKYPLHIGIDPEELLFIVKLPHDNPFGVCFDVGKAYFSVNNYSIEEVIDYLKKVTPFLKEVHLNAFDGYQQIISYVLTYLEDIGFNGPIVLECDRNKIDLLRKLFL